MSTRVAQFGALILALPSWALVLVLVAIPVSLGEMDLPVFVIYFGCYASLVFAIAVSFCASDFSGWRSMLLVLWVTGPVLFVATWGLVLMVKNQAEIGNWFFDAASSCIYKMILELAHLDVGGE